MVNRILLLSCPTGEGHNSAAKALKRYFESQNIYAEIKDPVSFLSKGAAKTVAKTYNSIIRYTPKMFGAIYRAGDAFSKTKIKSPVYFFNSFYAKRLNRYITENGFTAVISTHLFGMMAMTSIKKRKLNSIKSCGVLTDYTGIPFYSETVLDYHFIPHKDLLEEILECGFKEETVIDTGIPVNIEFSENIPKEKAREELGIDRDRKMYLVMSGGVGCGNMADLCSDIINTDRTDSLIYVLAGNNAEMLEKLNNTFGGNERVHAVSFTDRVYMYMKAADVAISKAGGLSSTECAVSQIPLVHLMTIPGCETCNADFFSSRGMSVKVTNDADAADEAYALLNDGKRCEEMKRKQYENTHRESVKEIAERVLI